MDRCFFCDKPMSANTEVCDWCGIRQSYTPPPPPKPEKQADAKDATSNSVSVDGRDQGSLAAAPEQSENATTIYCSSCSKQISGNSKYCLHCGKPIGPSPSSTSVQTVTTWEYRDVTLTWPQGHLGWLRADVYPEPSARLSYWQNIGSEITSELQELYDEGWQPVGEIGPACIQLRYYKSLEGISWFWVIVASIFTYGIALLFVPFRKTWKFQMIGLRIKIRRPKTDGSPTSHEEAIFDYVPSKQEFVERK